MPESSVSGPNWYVYPPTDNAFPPAPPWRCFPKSGAWDHWDISKDKRNEFPEELVRSKVPEAEPRAALILGDDRKTLDAINAAICLRRPLLVTGLPGIGKSSLAYDIASKLGLGRVLVWPINTRSTLKEGLYDYDAIGRLQSHKVGDPESEIGEFITLGPLGTALLPTPVSKPRVLLIDEIDKGDIDLPNDLLHVFEEGHFEIRELSRITAAANKGVETAKRLHQVCPHDSDRPVSVKSGHIHCREFPIVVMTSNGEKDFPAPFLRRCIRLDMTEPDPETLKRIVHSHFKSVLSKTSEDEARSEGTVKDFLAGEPLQVLIKRFVEDRSSDLATDQFLNAAEMLFHSRLQESDLKLPKGQSPLLDALLRPLQ